MTQNRLPFLVRSRVRPAFWSVFCALALLPFATRAEDAAMQPMPLRALMVGGGPNKDNNQVAIEGNVRYVGKLLPPGTKRTVLFADGDPDGTTVLYEEDARALPVEERLLRMMLQERESTEDSPAHYRKPNLGAKLDGAAKAAEVEKAFTRLRDEADRASQPSSLLLYFTGHGSANKRDAENNVYDLWGGNEQLSVRDLARHISRLPQTIPVTVIMVQCFSGAFGNLIFEGGDPQGAALERDLAGFFAAIKERVAAGCTSEVNEAEYHDFTSYFFAALTGRDRVGRRVTGADYNGDGRVGMNEAYCYTLANDRSIDVPVCTSDVFLRRFVPTRDETVFRVPYSDVQRWATPAQRAALDALSTKLQKQGNDRLETAYRQMREGFTLTQERDAQVERLSRRFETARQEGRNTLLRLWPELRSLETQRGKSARQEALTYLKRQAAEGRWEGLLQAESRLHEAEVNAETQEVAESYLIRFVRLGKSVILAHRLQTEGAAPLRARFARLVEAEGRSLLPPADSPRNAALSARDATDAGVVSVCRACEEKQDARNGEQVHAGRKMGKKGVVSLAW